MLHFTVGLMLLVCAVQAVPSDEPAPYENINITAYEELQLQQGDMIPDPSYGRAGHKSRRWPNGVLSYIIHDSLAREPQAMKAIKEAMEE
ncbi:hypothetical protein OS493_039908 [Desmophyllum pertusum]|uniref:Peptidase M12A domain-containing protein n=1 Tax=Desmophyllum pertusum TaxID=174260 RepID=A0A9X0CTM8_9CNID|nr:hypothetical protein OS493_039908 [Desmophyllum pertusum]